MQTRGIAAALLAALLFGVSTPLAKALSGDIDPVGMAGLLYLGSGIGLFAWRRIARAKPVDLPRDELPWLIGAITCGGLLAPVALLVGLAGLRGSDASLLLNAEPVFTVLIAWGIFHENLGRRIVVGMAAIVAGAAILSWPAHGATLGGLVPTLLVTLACLLWAADNNLTWHVSATDASWLAMVKGLTAGLVNTLIAVGFGAPLPQAGTVGAVLLVGFACYGVSLVQFIVALRLLGTARAGAYFSVAPFVGAVVAVTLLNEPLTWQLVAAGVLMGIGVWLHLTERHEHEHHHPAMSHSHRHTHDDGHHDHDHPDGTPTGPHTHWHTHPELTHSHPHYPDLHHRHAHDRQRPSARSTAGS